MSDRIHRNSLKPEHKLHWYVIERVLGQGGFGITYLAYDFNLDQHVAIKEYLPMELAVREGDNSVYPASASHGERYRWGLERFITEARTLAKFKHPAIVRVLSVFEENHTAYMVMEYERGESLQDILTRRKTMEEPELMKILFPILGGLELIHASGFIHRDIKPANIFIREDQSPVLLDFGSARQALGLQTRTLTSIVSPGYAPFEQYYSKSDKQGPWTDIYGLGATLYRAISGRPPMDAIDRSEAILKAQRDVFVPAVEVGRGRYSQRFLKAIDHALLFSEKQRPQSVAAWREEFGIPAEEEVSPLPADEAAASRTNFVLGLPPDPEDEEQESMTLDITTGEVFATPSRPSSGLAPPSEALRTTAAAPPPLPARRSRTLLFGALAAVLLAGIALGAYWVLRPAAPVAPAGEAAPPPIPQVAGAGEPAAAVAPTPPASTPALGQVPEQVGTLLGQARQALAAGKLAGSGTDSAAAIYQQVLKLDPHNAEASDGMTALVSGFAANGRAAAQRHDFATARRYLQEALSLAPDSTQLKGELSGLDAQERQWDLEQRERARERQVQALLKDAASNAAAGRLTAPAESNALGDYRAVLVLDPGNAEAQQGLVGIAARFAAQARQAQAAGDWTGAEGALNQALQITPQDPQLRNALGQVKAAQAKAAAAAQQAAQQQQIAALLSAAGEDLQALRLTTPPGNNALEAYRQVLTLDPGSQQAKQGIQRIADKYMALSQQASDAGDLDRAGAYLDRAAEVAPGASNVALAREQLELRKQQAAKAAEAQQEAEAAAQRKAEAQRKAQEAAQQAEQEAIRKAAAAALLKQSEEAKAKQEQAARKAAEEAAKIPVAAVRIRGLTPDFERYGLKAQALRSAVEQRLKAAGYQVKSVDQAGLAANAVLVDIILHANLNTSVGTYSYSATLQVMGRLSGGTGVNAFAPKPIWSGGENGMARPIELSRLNRVYLSLLGQFLSGQKGL